MARSPPIITIGSQSNNNFNNKLLGNNNKSRPNQNQNNSNVKNNNNKKVKSTIQIKSRSLKSIPLNNKITAGKSKTTTTSQSRHSDPLPRLNLLHSPRHKAKQPQNQQRKSLPNNLNLTVPKSINVNRISITNPLRTNYLTTSDIDEEGPIIPQQDSRRRGGGSGGEEESGEEEEDSEEGEEGNGDGGNGDSSDDSSLGDSSDSDTEIGVSVQLNDGYETVDPAYVTKKLRELKRGPLLNKHELESQEITLAFESSIARSKALFIGFLGGEITKELINASEEIEGVLSAGVRMFESKKSKHLDRMERDSEKVDQLILKFSGLSKKLISRRQQLSNNLQVSRETLDKELNTLKKNYETSCKSVQQPPSKSKSKTSTTGGGGGGRKSRS